MKEGERVGLQVEAETSRNEEGRVLVRTKNLPNEREFRKTTRFSPIETPIHLSLVVTDIVQAGVELFRSRNIPPELVHEVPHGNGEAVILGTGLLAGKATLRLIAELLRRINYKPVPASLPYFLNWELLEKRAEVLIKVSQQERTTTGKKVKWWLWSKETVAAMVAMEKHPKKVSKLVDHIVFCGIPLECELNPIVGQIYLATQRLNKLVFGENDFALLKRLNLADGVRVPDGVGFTIIESRNNGISRFQNGDYPGTFFVNGAHSGLGFNQQVWKISAYRFAGR